jgi:hypothetical protein
MKTVVNFFSSVGFVILTGLMVVSGNSLASTPDGETPANEGVCDPLKADGITKGLYGLCVAYCEAQDLDLLGDKDPPNTRILDNYNKKKTENDPGMPCVQAPCPCWTTEQLANISNSGGMPTCFIDSNAGTAVLENSANAQIARIDTSRPICRFRDPIIGISVRFDGFTDAEAQSCYDQIIGTQACMDLGQ